LVSREISEVFSLFHSLPGRSADGYFFLRSFEAEIALKGVAGWSRLHCIIVHFIERGWGVSCTAD